jgi:hypothetical protein
MKTVKLKLANLFNTFFLGFGILVISSCNQNNPQPNQPSTGTVLQWNVTIGGQNYSWQGSYPDNMTGGSALAASNGTSTQPFSIVCGKDGGTFIGISLPVYNSGSFSLNSSNYAISNYISFTESGSPNYSTSYGGSVTVNVTQFPSSVNGVIKGTFSGTIGKSSALGGGTAPISGSFDALRSN